MCGNYPGQGEDLKKSIHQIKCKEKPNIRLYPFIVGIDNDKTEHSAQEDLYHERQHQYLHESLRF